MSPPELELPRVHKKMIGQILIGKNYIFYVGLIAILFCGGCEACCEAITCADGLDVSIPVDDYEEIPEDPYEHDYIVVWSTENADGEASYFHGYLDDPIGFNIIIYRSKDGLTLDDNEIEITVLRDGEVFIPQQKYNFDWEKISCGSCAIGGDKHVYWANILLEE